MIEVNGSQIVSIVTELVTDRKPNGDIEYRVDVRRRAGNSVEVTQYPFDNLADATKYYESRVKMTFIL